MARLFASGLVWALLIAGCSEAALPGDPTDPGDDMPPDEDQPPEPPPDEFPEPMPPADDGYVPKPFSATRFGVFYQLSRDVIDLYQDEQKGLPHVAGHAWLITQSHATAFASKAMAELVHRRDDFYYAPAFDVWDASHDGWLTVGDDELRRMAYEFRDAAIAAHADLFAMNEAPTSTGSNANVRVRFAKLLRFIHEPDAQGRQLWGVTFFTQKPSSPTNWDGPGSDFFKAIDDTSVALVVEFYHASGYTCANSTGALANHYFALRDWMMASGEPAKLSIANSKFTVLHSSRFADGTSGWAGGDATKITLADFQRALSRNALVTRTTSGGFNRMAFGPTTTAITQFGVQPRIAALFRWHYLHTAAQSSELPCIDNFGGNCTCQ